MSRILRPDPAHVQAADLASVLVVSHDEAQGGQPESPSPEWGELYWIGEAPTPEPFDIDRQGRDGQGPPE